MTHDKPPELWDTAARIGLSMVPFAGGALQIIWEDARSRLQWRFAKTVDEIAEVTGVDELRRRLEEDPELEALFMLGVDLATRTGLEAKRRALVRAVSTAVLDDSRVEDGQLIVFALRDLDAPHVRALARLWHVQLNSLTESSTDAVARKQTTTAAVNVAAALEAGSIISALHRADVVRSTGLSLGGVTTGEVTAFGQRLLEELGVVTDDGLLDRP